VNYIKPNFWNKNSAIVYLLWPLSIITKLINIIKKFKNKYKPKISTICIGNIYLGGTGKTQLAIKISQILKNQYKTIVIKKNYKDQIDEQKLLKKYSNLLLTNFRVDAIKKIEKSKKNIAILDDGLQDKSIKYKISIVCFSSLNGVGNGRVLPAGPLRESLLELKNYDAVFINGKKNNNLVKKIKNINNHIKIFNGKYYLKNKNLFSLNSKYLAFCGIGTPENFFSLLKENKINIVKKMVFPDHFKYTNSDINEIIGIARKNNLKIVTTEKDFMKLKKFKNLSIKYTDVDLKIEKFSLFKKFLKENI
tara:strand:+ start:2983 stop:3903 length:921 start_codon:yes stop_codon:yes gene_type:complete